MKKILTILLSTMFLASCAPATPSTTAAGTTTAAATTTAMATTTATAGGEIILSTTTSTRDSGLLDFLLPEFKKATGIEVKVVALGTGAAIESAKAGNADVLMVHDKAKEDQFVADGFGLKRYDLMYNDFLLASAPDNVSKIGTEKNIVNLMKLIEAQKMPFISRGDESGTHSFEKKTWKAAGVTLPEGTSDWYFSIGQGMSDTLNVTAEKKGFTISDRSTFLATKATTKLVEVSEPSAELVNQYGVIELNPAKVTLRNPEGAKQFIEWILSDEAKALISEYGKTEYGQQLFFPGTFK
ncbi:MAG: substrate-binding domain-containing protein [Clostridiaceae bacterium]